MRPVPCDVPVLGDREASSGPWAAGNRLLAALPANELETLQPSLVPVTLESGQILYRSGDRIPFVYFPDSAVASLLSRMANEAVVEIGTIGNESVIGLGLALGNAVSLPETIIQVPGTARRMTPDVFLEALRNLPRLRQLVGRCTSAFITQVSQTAACNRLHVVEQRCARWLLLTHDRMGGENDVPLTHQFLSYMLGVRRAGVTEALGMLAVNGLVRAGKGRITIIDRPGLESASCECYAIVRAHAVEPFAPEPLLGA